MPVEITGREGAAMLRFALIFFIIAIIAALLGFTTIAGAAIEIAVFIFYIFIILFVISLIVGLISGRRV